MFDWSAFENTMHSETLKSTLGVVGTNNMWSLDTGGLYMQAQWQGFFTDPWGPVKSGLYKQVVFIYRLSLEKVWLY